mmetsp:Transcript_28865/g.37689  ORF Transcript_28865/g.37689 Transcript_28865/m.37689 type:complete len:325 (-) Transcript_28865:63-1037(-)
MIPSDHNSGRQQTTDTSNDESIARAIASAERIDAQIEADEALARQLLDENRAGATRHTSSTVYPGQRRSPNNTPLVSTTSPNNRCSAGCVLTPSVVSSNTLIFCDGCKRCIDPGKPYHTCNRCHYSICTACKNRQGAPPIGRIVGMDAPQQPVSQRGFVPQQQRSTGATTADPPPISRALHVPMCHVPCVLGDHICVEMMVDTGAQKSVISIELARELGLESNIDRREWGVAAGVGRARILGKISNVICVLGHVEFHMDFLVLDVTDRLLLLGLDQMRKYNCIVDLQRDVLIFGGNGGVEVPMLPPTQPDVQMPNIFGESCSIS